MVGDNTKLLRRVAEQTLDLAFRFGAADLDRVQHAAKWYVWDWYMGVALYGLWRAYELLEDETYLSRIKRWIDERAETGIPKLCVNTSAPMATVLRLYQIYPEQQYETLCRDFDDYILNQAPRTPSGALAHTVIERDFLGQVWVDTLFMGIIYLTQRGVQLNSRAHLEEAARQRVVHVNSLYDERDGLFYHAWDDDAQQPMGAKWGRGNAWMLNSALEMLESEADVFPDRAELLAKLDKQLAALERHQDANGYWHTVIDHPNTYPETSVTAGVAAGALKGIRLGLIDARFKPMAFKAIRALVAKIDEEGNVLGGSGGTSVKQSVAEYNAVPIAILPFTQGLTLMALCEAIRAGSTRPLGFDQP